MVDILEAASGQQIDAGRTAGPSTIVGGIFSIKTNLGRVDEALVDSEDVSWVAAPQDAGEQTYIQVEVASQGSGNAPSDDTDLSGVTFRYAAYRL